MVYLVTFVVSTLFVFFCTKIDISNKKNKFAFVLCAMIAILLPSILAGLRTTEIGTDIKVYVLSDFYAALSKDNIFEYMKLDIYREPLYKIVTFFVANIFESINWVLFFYEFIIMSCFFIGGYRHKDKISFPILYFICLLMFYNNSLNAVRQYIAMSIIFMGISTVENKKYMRFIPYVTIAFLFHRTSILAILFPIIHFGITTGSAKRKKMFFFLIIMCIMLVLVFFKPVTMLLIDMGIISEHYMYYIDNDVTRGSNTNTVLYCFEIFIILLYYKILKQNIENFGFYSFNAIIYLMTLQLARVMYAGDRISLYLHVINTYLLVQLPKITNNKKYKIILYLGLCIMTVAYWWYLFILNGVSETYPYNSILDVKLY